MEGQNNKPYRSKDGWGLILVFIILGLVFAFGDVGCIGVSGDKMGCLTFDFVGGAAIAIVGSVIAFIRALSNNRLRHAAEKNVASTSMPVRFWKQLPKIIGIAILSIFIGACLYSAFWDHDFSA